MVDWDKAFSGGLPYDEFLQKYGSAKDRDRWAAVFSQFRLSEVHVTLLSGFLREMNVLCLAGAWCGDCVAQCPLFEHFTRACPKFNLRFLDRDAHPDVAEELRVCGGARVPVVVLLSEDFAECARYGDRTLSRYRAMASQLGGRRVRRGS